MRQGAPLLADFGRSGDFDLSRAWHARFFARNFLQPGPCRLTLNSTRSLSWIVADFSRLPLPPLS